MGIADLVLEVALLALLGTTLVYAIRLERALRTLRQDRAALGEAIAGFDTSTRQAELGLGRLQSAATETAASIGHRVDQAASLKNDLQFLIERGEGVADRLDHLVRATRPLAAAQPAAQLAPQSSAVEPAKVRSQAERDLLAALRGAQ